MARYIDADKLLKDMESVTNDTTCPLHLAAEIDQIISLSPTADVVEVKHGHYKYDEKDDKWRCSECSAERPRNNGEIPYSDIYCCYKCGAQMDGGNDE